jgi:parvulin-like peptidyl-prolyl isomerase
MAVVINEFEVTPRSEPAGDSGKSGKGQDGGAPPAQVVKDVEKALRKKMERQRRLWAY